MTVNLRRGFALSIPVVFAVLLGLAAWALPSAIDAARLMARRDDPVAVADAGLDLALTPQRFSQGFEAALASGDADLAESFVELGRLRGLAPTAEQSARLDALRNAQKEKAVEEFADGFLHGQREGSAAFAGALAGDLSGYGDLRDLWNEGEKLHRGEKADTLVVGLAAAGLALSIATWSSIGAILPARSGLTLVKNAQRAGRLSAPLAKSLSAVAAKTVDREALAASVAAAAKLDLVAARAAVKAMLRPGAVEGFRALGADVATLYRRAGARGVKDALALAEDGAELRKAARLGAVRGGATRAIFSTLGRGALVFAGLTAAAVEAVFALLTSLLGMAMMAQRFGFWLGRVV
jgi:hypothetical protein